MSENTEITVINGQAYIKCGNKLYKVKGKNNNTELEQRVTDLETDVENINKSHQDNTDFVEYMVNNAENTDNEGAFLMVKDGLWQAVHLTDVSTEGA